MSSSNNNFLKEILKEMVIDSILILLFLAIFKPGTKLTLLFILGYFLIDLDHFIWIIVGEKITSIRKAYNWYKTNMEKRIPHFYPLHTFEVLSLFLFVGYFFSTPFLFLALGFTLNVLADILIYLKTYKSTKPWLKYFSFFLYLSNKNGTTKN